jgi:TonB-linked SusC/RagA family outer membrane protein
MKNFLNLVCLLLKQHRKKMIVMRNTVLILLISALQVFATGSYAQTKKISLAMNDATIREVLYAIQNQSEFYFLYNSELIDVTKKVDITIEEEKVDAILTRLFNKNEVDFLIKDRYIVLTPVGGNAELFAEQQQRAVSGTVSDESGQPLPGVTVMVKGTTQGTVTNNDGNYSITNIPENATLVFSFVGMRTQEVVVGDQTNINVNMVIDAIGIEEVVAIGYGVQKKENLTGSISMVTSDRLENRPIASVGQGLQGVVPNLNIKYNSGSPSETPDINIRGFESINGGEPLILVDGVPMDLERINPNDIKSITVLKDASASAVYGARAAFGVILVETKKGQKGKMQVTFGIEQSITQPIFKFDFVQDPYTFVTAVNGAWERKNGVPRYDNNYVEGTKKWSENPIENNAWGFYNGELRFYGNNKYEEKLLEKFSPQQKYDLSISGASEKNSYYLSFGFLNKDGFLKINNENYKRYNAIIKNDYKVTDWLLINGQITFNSQINDSPHIYHWNVGLNSLARQSPIYPLEFPDLPYYIEPGDHEKFEKYIGMGTMRVNFLPYLENGGRTTWTTNDTWLSFGSTLNPLNGLNIKSDFSYRTYWRDFQDVASKVETINLPVIGGIPILSDNLTSYVYTDNDFIQNRINRSQYYVFNTYAEYELEGLIDNYLKIMLGYNQEWGRNNNVTATSQNLIIPSITDISATTGSQQTSGSKDHYSLRGIFYRLNYIFKEKYLIEASGRYDGSSRFPQKSRFGFFPSFSLGWRISNEPFMENVSDWLDNLKIRASYGELGNQLLGTNYYPYISAMGSGLAAFPMSSSESLIPYVSAAGLVSPSLTWEKVEVSNLGFDLFINQRLDVTFDIYTRNTKNMLMNVQYPDILGTSAPKENAADLKTNGWELYTTWRDRINKDWSYSFSVGLSDNQTKITKYQNPTGNINDYYVGKKIGEIWGFETVGIFQYEEDVANAADQSQIGTNWRAGDIQYKDLNGDGKITRGNFTLDEPGDLIIIGNSSPRYSYSITPDIKYKNWSVNFFFQGLFRDFWPENGSHKAFWPFNTDISIYKFYITESWSENNRDAYFPAPTWREAKNMQVQSRYLQNAAYIRLKNITLNYDVPSDFTNKIRLDKVQLYFSGMNLWEYTKMHHSLDPEQRDNLEQTYYFQRIFTFGTKITF